MTNLEIIQQEVENYKKLLQIKQGRWDRALQADDINQSLMQHFKLEGPINIIETGASHQWHDGMMGVLFAKIAQRTGGQMWIVDIDPQVIENSKQAFALLGLDFVQFHVGDSVEFLQNFNEQVDLIHLDSWDLNLLDPFPSALHGWREFEAIKDKVGSDCVIIVDDNYLEGTWVDWNVSVNGRYTGQRKRVDIIHPCVGKGTHIWWWAQQDHTDWNLIHVGGLASGRNIKIICQKK